MSSITLTRQFAPYVQVTSRTVTRNSQRSRVMPFLRTFKSKNWLVAFFVAVNLALLGSYMFSVNMYAGLSYEQSRLTSILNSSRAKAQELKVQSAEHSSVARAQNNLDLQKTFVATGLVEVISLDQNTPHYTFR